MSEHLVGFTPEDITQGAEYESLGPEYFAARRIVERQMAKFTGEQFKPLIDEFADQFRSKLWEHVQDSMLSDVEMNMQTEVCGMVEGTIRALLTGEEWAMKRYPFCEYRDGDKIRAKIAEHVGDEIANRRISDLEKEVKRMEEGLRFERRDY